MQLRGAIILDEKDLLGPLPPSACSSLDDGPFCARFGLGGSPSVQSSLDHLAGTERTAAPSFFSRADLQGSDSAMYVVDGVLSNWMQTQNKEAFDWSPDTLRTFSNLVSRVISDSLGSAQDITRQGNLPGKQQANPMARTGSQCFRLAFRRLSPALRYVPASFSVGLPEAIAASWEGLWEVQAIDARRGRSFSAPSSRSTRDRRASLEAAPRPPWAAQVVLRTALGYVRFAQPLVVRRLLVGVPPAAAVGELWGQGSLICGRLKGQEQWCSALDLVAASARSPKAASEEDLLTGGLHWADVGNSIRAVDEVAIIAAPTTGLAIGLIEVVATLPSHPLHGLPSQRRVVLLRPSRGKEQSLVEPSLEVVSRDAAVWDMNEVVRHNMRLRNHAAAGRREAAAAKVPPIPVQKELSSFQEMLQGLKAGVISPPPGVPFARLKREVAALVASTKEIQADDVLLHSRIESLLQERMRKKSLDGLLALQAAWRLRSGTAASRPGAAPAASGATSAAKAPAPASAAAAAASSATPKGTASAAAASTAVSEEGADGKSQRWADDAAEAMDHASKALERKAAEVRKKQQQKGGPDFLQMELEDGTIELRLGDGAKVMQALHGNGIKDLVRQLTKAMTSGQTGGGAAEADLEVGKDLVRQLQAAMTSGQTGGDQAEADLEAGKASEDGEAGIAAGARGESRGRSSDDEDEQPAAGGAKAVNPESLAAQMSQMMAAALSQAGVGGVGGAGATLEVAAGDEGLGDALQQAIRRQMTGSSGEEQADSEGNPMKMQLHFVKLEDLAGGEAESGAMAQMLQSLFNQQGGGASAVSAATFTAEEMQSLLRAQQRQSGGGEDGSGEGDAEVSVDAEDVVAL